MSLIVLLLSLLCLFTVFRHVPTQSGGTIGLTLLTITGSSFDTSGLVTIGTLPCIVQKWTALSIVCQSPPGQGLSQVIQITTVHTSSNTGGIITFGYTAPVITSIKIIKSHLDYLLIRWECRYGVCVIRYDHSCHF